MKIAGSTSPGQFVKNTQNGTHYVQRPLRLDTDRKNAFIALLQYAPIPKSTTNRVRTEQKVSTLQSNGNRTNTRSKPVADQLPRTQHYEVNMTPNSKQYAISLNDQYVSIIALILFQNVPTPLYLRSVFQTTLSPEAMRVSTGARRIMLEENAGGQSELSEGFSFEILKRVFGAKLVKTEMAIRYWWNSWKKTDYSVRMNGQVIGVSVTRAMKYRGIFNRGDAEKLLRKKLFGINESTLGVLEQDEWQRQILHIWATDEYVERVLYETFLDLLFTEPDLVRNTIIMVTVTSSWWIFYQDKYIKAKEKKERKEEIRKEMTEQTLDVLPPVAVT